jgi:hypothetical protein
VIIPKLMAESYEEIFTLGIGDSPIFLSGHSERTDWV